MAHGNMNNSVGSFDVYFKNVSAEKTVIDDNYAMPHG